MSTVKFHVSAGRRILLLFLCFLLGTIITSVIAGLLLNVGGADRQVAMLRIGAVVQDVVMLVLPAVATAMIVTRNPAGLLTVDSRPSARMLLWALAAMVVSMPAMSYVIEWNASISFPESLKSLEEALRQMEENAAGSIELMMGPHTVMNLIVNVLIIGLFAGFSEELFFRGALQRLLQSTRMSPAAAVWIAAIVFSAVHFQFFGFVPRMLLGAFFGYLLLWSGSVWLAVAAHAFNNVMYVVLTYFTGSGDPQFNLPFGEPWLLPLVSALLTAGCLVALHRSRLAAQ